MGRKWRRNKRFWLFRTGTALLLGLLSATNIAAWTNDPASNTVVSAQPTNENDSIMISDGAGGAIIAWQDMRNEASSQMDIYAQRLDPNGDPMWGGNGIPVVTTAGSQSTSAIISDGLGGAVVVWRHENNFWAQRLNAKGERQWASEGVAVTTVAGGGVAGVNRLVGVDDGSGGVIFSWEYTTAVLFPVVMARHLNAGGAVLWDKSIATDLALIGQFKPKIIKDAAGGAIIAWDTGSVTGDGQSVMAQRIDGEGKLLWGTAGITVRKDLYALEPRIISDGSGGAIVSWLKQAPIKIPVPRYSLHAQRLDAAGTLLWPAAGVDLLADETSTYSYTMLSDNNGGAIVVWEDVRTPAGDTDIYAQRVDSNGALQWMAGGAVVTTQMATQQYVRAVSDTQGGAVVAWEDHRNLATPQSSDIYAQRINASGVLLWGNADKPVSTAPDYQGYPNLLSDGSGGGILAWDDYRNAGNDDVYAQRVFADGSLSDTTPPVTTASVVAGSYSSPQSIALTCDDAGASGCTATYYSITGSEPQANEADRYSGAISLDKSVTLKFYSVDRAGNIEATNSYDYTITPAANAAGSSNSGFGCSLHRGGEFDPLLPLLLVAALMYLAQARRRQQV